MYTLKQIFSNLLFKNMYSLCDIQCGPLKTSPAIGIGPVKAVVRCVRVCVRKKYTHLKDTHQIKNGIIHCSLSHYFAELQATIKVAFIQFLQ